MKDLFNAIKTDFEYHEGDYYFSTTIEGSEYEITSTLRDGNAMFTMFYIDNEDADREAVNELLNSLAFENYSEEPTKEELEEQDKFMNTQYQNDKI